MRCWLYERVDRVDYALWRTVHGDTVQLLTESVAAKPAASFEHAKKERVDIDPLGGNVGGYV